MNDEIKEILEDLKEHSHSKYVAPFELIDIECQLLLDYITNLQEENERLKELCDKYEEEHNTAFKLWKGKLKETMDETLIQKQYDRIKKLEAINEEHRKINGELRETINKAIEYVENENTDRFNNPTYEFALELRKNKLLNILQGSDE